MTQRLSFTTYTPGMPVPLAPNPPTTPGVAMIPADPWTHSPDLHLRAADESGDVRACCSLWTRAASSLKGRTLGFIGHYFADSREASSSILATAVEELRRQRCDLAVGPIDGSTWRRYRFVTESSTSPAYFMEPTNPPEWPIWWEDAGFQPLAGYHSSLNSNTPVSKDQLELLAIGGNAAGLSLRVINLDRFEEELVAIYRLSCESFTDNFLYSPITWEEFRAMYLPIRSLVKAPFVLLADDPRRPGELAGFLMALPDANELRAGKARTLILKSMAVHPVLRSLGLGSWLIAQVQESAAAAGMDRIIFALMHDENNSARISAKYANVIRRYTLYSRALDAPSHS